MSDETQSKDGEAQAGPADGTVAGGQDAAGGTTEASPPQEGNEQLSQDEVQALLRGVEDGEVVAEDSGSPDGQVRLYDLIGEDRIVGQRFPAIELAQDRLARALPQSLAAFTGTPSEVSIGRPDLLRYGTFRNRLETPASLHLFTMAPLRGQGVVVLSPELAFGIVDRFFGGSGTAPGDLAGRTSSAIELQMLQRLVAAVLADLAAAWAPLHKVAFAFARSESNLASVALTGMSDLMLLLPVECGIATGPAPLTIAIPFPALEPLRAKLGEPRAASSSGPDGEWRHVLAAAVRDADVTVTAELGQCDVSTRQMLEWRAGDVLALDAASDDPLSLCAEGIRLMSGAPGVSRGSNAVRILGTSE